MIATEARRPHASMAALIAGRRVASDKDVLLPGAGGPPS